MRIQENIYLVAIYNTEIVCCTWIFIVKLSKYQISLI